MACKEGQFDVVELMVNDKFKTFSINLNAQRVNGITPFTYVRLLDTLEYQPTDIKPCLLMISKADNSHNVVVKKQEADYSPKKWSRFGHKIVRKKGNARSYHYR